MKKVHDWFLPDYDQHYEEWMQINNEKNYQRGKQLISLLSSLGYKEYGRSRKKEVVFIKV